MLEKQTITCVACPKGCEVTVEHERKVLSYDSFYKGRDSRIEHLIKPPLFNY